MADLSSSITPEQRDFWKKCLEEYLSASGLPSWMFDPNSHTDPRYQHLYVPSAAPPQPSWLTIPTFSYFDASVTVNPMATYNSNPNFVPDFSEESFREFLKQCEVYTKKRKPTPAPEVTPEERVNPEDLLPEDVCKALIDGVQPDVTSQLENLKADGFGYYANMRGNAMAIEKLITLHMDALIRDFVQLAKILDGLPQRDAFRDFYGPTISHERLHGPSGPVSQFKKQYQYRSPFTGRRGKIVMNLDILEGPDDFYP